MYIMYITEHKDKENIPNKKIISRKLNAVERLRATFRKPSHLKKTPVIAKRLKAFNIPA